MKQKISRQEKKEKRLRMWYGVITILVMVSGGFAIFADSIGSGGNSKYDYNDYEFEKLDIGNVQLDIGYRTKIAGNELDFYYHPSVVDYMPLDSEVREIFANDNGMFVTSSHAFEQIGDVKSYLMSHLYYDFGKLTLNAATYENEENVTVINCSDATEEKPVVTFVKSPNVGFGYENYCITMMGPDELSLYRLSDRVLYSLHGIIEN